MEEKSDVQYDIKDFYDVSINPNDSGVKSWCVEVKKGPLTGFMYRYTMYQLGDKVENKVYRARDVYKLYFNFEVLYVPEEIIGVDFSGDMKESFHDLLSEILVDLIKENKEKGFSYESDGDEGGDININESSKERFFFESNNSVSAE